MMHKDSPHLIHRRRMLREHLATDTRGLISLEISPSDD
jgi:hypothetical protein